MFTVENGENSAEQEDEADKENEDEGDNAEGEEELDAKGVAQLEESIGGEEDEEDDDNDDEDDSLKLSWQMLDWARKLLETATDNEVYLNKCKGVSICTNRFRFTDLSA